ncbi:MAG: hypothetical protein IAE80_08240 [Anaerolinea sp.]|nr:hypothetical protein [Anaerolinea sp.]
MALPPMNNSSQVSLIIKGLIGAVIVTGVFVIIFPVTASAVYPIFTALTLGLLTPVLLLAAAAVSLLVFAVLIGCVVLIIRCLIHQSVTGC